MLRIKSTGFVSRTILTYNQYLHKISFQLLSVGRDVLLSGTQIVLTFIPKKLKRRFDYKHLLGFYGDISIHQRCTKSLFHELMQPSQTILAKNFNNLFFLQQSLPTLTQTMLLKYFQSCIYIFRKKWEMNLTIGHNIILTSATHVCLFQ